MIRYLRASGLALLLGSSTLSGAIQPAALAQTSPQPTIEQPVVQQPAAPQPALAWRRAAAVELVAYVEQSGREGLDPADYRLAELRTSLMPKLGLQRRGGSQVRSEAGPQPGGSRQRAGIAFGLSGGQGLCRQAEWQLPALRHFLILIDTCKPDTER